MSEDIEFNPEAVDRYDLWYGDMDREPDGYWVTAEDYDKLLSLYRQMKKNLEKE